MPDFKGGVLSARGADVACFVANIAAHLPSQLGQKGVQLSAGSLCDKLHAAVGQVLHVSGYVETAGKVPRGVAKSHALDVTGVGNSPLLDQGWFGHAACSRCREKPLTPMLATR